MNHTWKWEPSKKEKIIVPVIKLEILSGIPQGYVLGPFSFPLQYSFPDNHNRTRSTYISVLYPRTHISQYTTKIDAFCATIRAVLK